ncbi:MAG: HvfX family Cu-binding RiPP maturation protein [Lysobacter sp.]
MSPLFFSRVDAVGRWLAPTGLRVLLAWEFFEAGLEKLNGSNWFADLGEKFPFPFSLLGPDLNWTMATWLELSASVALLLGLGTRYAAFALWVLTAVAIYAVHWPSDWSSLSELWQGYAITDHGHGNYKLPLLYLAMLLPLILNGGGQLSLDRLFAKMDLGRASADRRTWGLTAFGFGLPLSLLLPWLGGGLVALGVVLIAFKPGRAPKPAPLSAAYAMSH